jgi:hypothetical protein
MQFLQELLYNSQKSLNLITDTIVSSEKDQLFLFSHQYYCDGHVSLADYKSIVHVTYR